MPARANYYFSIWCFLYFAIFFFSRDNGSPDELHKSKTRLVVKFYLDFLCFHLCSVGLYNAKYVVIMLLYYSLN